MNRKEKKTSGDASPKKKAPNVDDSSVTKVRSVADGLPPDIRSAMKKAFENVKALSDTDVFPRSFETFLLGEMESDVLELLAKVHLDFQGMLDEMPPVNDRVLATVGYSGFRSVTQIDPIWNLYLLSLVIKLGNEIEAARVSPDKRVVHSYRFINKKGEPHLFDSDFGWFSFSAKCQELAEAHKFVLITDISDFYPRIYHHRLENALKKITKNTEVVKRIITLLTLFSGGVSYGLPVGGPAARLLSEIVINATDRMMLAERVVYCRFVDDFRIFADSREQAHALLVTLAQKIGESEGLSLQKAKTKIMSSEEYLAMTGARGEEEHDSADVVEYKNFMSLKLHFDPYSDTAKEDYEQLRESLAKFDVVGMLSRELRKSQVEEGLTRKLVRSIRHLDIPKRSSCVHSLAENLEILAPVFPVVMQAFTAVSCEIDDQSRKKMIEAVKDLFHSNSHIVQVPVNQLFAIRSLSEALDEDVEQILNKVYRETSSISVRRDVIALMANRDHAWFISDRRRNYQNLSSWERRAVLAASYILEDEGDHWRKRLSVNDYDKIISKFVSQSKVKNEGKVVLPL